MTSTPILFLLIFAICITQSLSWRRRRRRRFCTKVDCVVNPWSSWSHCSAKQCGQPGTRERRRIVRLPPKCGGTPCPSLVDAVSCRGDSRVDCQLSSWSLWSACSLLCGGVQTSTRYVVAKEQCGGTPCNSTSSKARACKVTGCLNQGILVDGQCSCISGYYGACCQHNSTQIPCPKGQTGVFPNCTGNCSDRINSFNCSCQSGFSGVQCEHNIDDCPSSGCGNGTCIDLVNNYTCQCNVGFTGQHCDDIIRNCSSDSCFPGVRCIQNPHTISCDPCPTGYTGDGKNCKDIDNCINVTCKNGGSCLDGINNFTCSCRFGYTGDWCEIDIDDCANVTCINNGTCSDGENRYSCLCQAGFTGRHCETDVDDCVSAQCANGATCEDGVNQYSCVCQARFSGKLCEIDINDCATQPCKNGTCQDGRNTYTCTCQPGFTGTHCETVFKLQLSIKREWDSSLGDSNSETFKKLSNLLKNEIYMAYSGFPDLKEVKIIGMRPGSIIADFQLIFKRALSTREALDPLLKETKDGKLGSLEVDPDSLQKSKVDEQGLILSVKISPLWLSFKLTTPSI